MSQGGSALAGVSVGETGAGGTTDLEVADGLRGGGQKGACGVGVGDSEEGGAWGCLWAGAGDGAGTGERGVSVVVGSGLYSCERHGAGQGGEMSGSERVGFEWNGTAM